MFQAGYIFTHSNCFMEQSEKAVSRKKFLSWGLVFGSVLAIPAFLRFPKKTKAAPKTAKMLTQDGQLIEIDIAHIPVKKKKIEPQNIHTWVTNKPGL
jgi:hypothetical protein